MMGGYLVGSTGTFCTPDSAQEVTAFFSSHKVPASASALTRAQNSINSCVDLRSEQGPKLKQWLASQPTSTGAKGD
jgi:hypothetical protein